jgi:hypothetical protein
MVSQNVQKALNTLGSNPALKGALTQSLQAIAAKATVKLTTAEKAEFLNALAGAAGGTNSLIALVWT